MPLLKRKAFEKSTVSEYLRDDDEVFHCEITDEIFKSYDEYCERIILVNSMVWTCEMTGKNNLTYAEALASEKAARRSLKDFPMELRIPILYLAWKTNRCSFAEMSEDVFNFVRDRFFVGESIEACLDGDVWREAHILSVTAVNQAPGKKEVLPAASYCYEVEQFEEESADAGQIGTAPHDRVRRKKGVYSRDKNRLFLKQFVQMQDGIICIKKEALDKYNILKTSFDQLFTGDAPDFPSSKKLLNPKAPPKPGSATKLNKSLKKTPDKKGKQESMDKFLKKSDKPETPKTPVDPNARKNAQELAEKMRRAEDQMRQRKEEEKAKKKEKHARLQAYLKEWHKAKDDLDLEDHKVIPKGTPIDVEGIPHEHFGDFLSVVEFLHVFSEILKVKDVFHNGLELDALRKALVNEEHAGAFSDLVQMFLTTIFSLQEDEAEEYNEDKGILLSTADKEYVDDGIAKAVEMATKASKWSQTYLGTPLSKLPLDPTTVSEVLRLHLLSSGSAAGNRCATWRYHQRGGYSSRDDAGLRLRRSRPQLLCQLASSHVADLPIEDKFQVLQCLMNQVLSYATIRDIIEEKLEEVKNTKQALRMLTINERKREVQVTAARQDLKKEFAAKKEELKLTGERAKQHEAELKAALEKLTKDSEEKKREYEKKLKQLQLDLFNYTSYIGSDRAYRRYFLNHRVAGLFVDAGSEPRGTCRDKPVPPIPSGQDTLAYITDMFENHRERAGSDKENDSLASSRANSPKKPLANVNGISKPASSTQQHRDLMVCSSDIDTCYAHGKSERPNWTVYHTEEQILALIESLNKRGVRENELRTALEADKEHILEYIKSCPVHFLNPAAALPPPTVSTRKRTFQPSLVVPPDSSLSEALELSLRDHILELEEKIFHGCLGSIQLKDREAWRGTIMLKGYDKQADYLSWGPHRQYRDDYHLPNGVLKLPTDDKTDIKSIPENKYRDPGHYLEVPKVNGVKSEPGTTSTEHKQDTVRGLASALLQVAQAIHQKYLKRPLGLDEKERKDREARNKPLELEALARWEVSLMECRSFSQIVLHLFTLDSSITWSASILNASCRLCRRKTDPDNMLLCDSCNKGHHLYCLKPKLTKVPEGDWFCDVCRPKEKTPRKRRKLFSDEELEEAMKSDSEGSIDAGVCGACGSGGALSVACAACGVRLHAECAGRDCRRYTCRACRGRDTNDSDDDILANLKNKKTRRSKEPSPMVNGTSKRGRKPKEEHNTSSSKKSKKSLTNGTHEESKLNRSKSKKGSSKVEDDVLLHQDKVEQLMKDILKHRECWPFYEPVDTTEVPDYLSVIETPMDFTTMKEKLTHGEYTTDQQLIDDAALVLSNCYTYNKETHPVAKAGVRLEKYIAKRCKELNLPEFPEITLDGEEVGAKRKSPADAEEPKAKRAKLK